MPQGSVLGQIFLTIFINNIAFNLSVPCLLDADDMKLFSVISSVEDCRSLQLNINNIVA